MSELATAPRQDAREAELAPPNSRLIELTVSAHLMTLEAGLFCIINTNTLAPGVRDGSGLPGVRVSPAPGPASRPEAVTIATFRDDGWLGGPDAAALVRVASGQAQILVTNYQLPSHGAEAAPRLQVIRLSPDTAGAPAQAAGVATSPAVEVLAHVSRMGDVTARLGEWVGRRGSQQAVEGVAVAPHGGGDLDGIVPSDLEYQAVLGRGWLSPWVEGGAFCGSRGMALPVLGLRVRLRGAAAETFVCRYSATFVDGTEIGPVEDGEACEADSLAALEAFQVAIVRKAAAAEEQPPEEQRPSRPARSARRAR
jgi:hypothetical protein